MSSIALLRIFHPFAVFELLRRWDRSLQPVGHLPPSSRCAFAPRSASISLPQVQPRPTRGRGVAARPLRFAPASTSHGAVPCWVRRPPRRAQRGYKQISRQGGYPFGCTTNPPMPSSKDGQKKQLGNLVGDSR